MEIVNFICLSCAAINVGFQKACLQCGSPCLPVKAEGISNPAQFQGPAAACPRCSEPVIADARFCLKCGLLLAQPAAPVSISCPNCGNQLAAGKKFCNRCGQRISPS